MKLLHFQAASDLLGRRIRVSWELEPEDGETLADAPPVRLRRKERDFDFPPPAPGADAFLVYDSTTFPEGPPAVATDLPGWEVREEGGGRTVTSVISVARPLGGRLEETSRRTVSTTFGPGGTVLRQRVEVLDLGGASGALVPRRTYYYQLFGASLPVDGDGAPRATATATEAYGLNKVLYDSLPEVYRRHDVVTRAPGHGSDSVPEAAPRGGQLRRFLDLFGLPLDSLRGSAEGLMDLRDVDAVDARFLPLLAKWLGWDLSFDVGIPVQRNELKAVPRFYRSVGTVPGLRALVSHYTGWFTQVAELAQHLLRANHPPQRNLFAATEAGGTWRGIDDAAAVLGFGPGNDTARGDSTGPARLEGTATEPFALRPGMELRLSVDGGPPAGVRFRATDFARPEAATASEVASALAAVLSEVAVRTTQDGRLELASHTQGPESALLVEAPPTSLVTLEGAPGGRPSATRDAAGRLHLLYEARELPASDLLSTGPVSAPARVARSATLAASVPGTAPEVRHKVMVDGAWRDSHPVELPTSAPRSMPTAAAIPDRRLWLAFVEAPDTPASRLCWVLGTPRPATPARLLGQRREPFALAPGTRLRLTGGFGAETFEVRETDFADVRRATASEVAAAINGRLSHVRAAAQPDRTLRLETVVTGDSARLEVDFAGSTTARALGFGPGNASARGHWDERHAWSAPQDVGTVPDGFHADPYALADAGGAVSLFWASHQEGRWHIHSARWDERLWVATSSGVSVRRGSGPFTTLGKSQGLPSADVRNVAVDARGMAWFATPAGVVLRRPDGTTSTFDTGKGLPSNDVRAVALAPDGTAWVATAGGVSLLREDGSHSTFTTADGLSSNDVRGVAVAQDGTVWLATAAALSVRPPGGTWRPCGPPDCFPGFIVRAVAVARDGTVWAATAGGLVRREPDGTVRIFGAADGLPSLDVRSVALGAGGAVWFGTSSGLCVRRPPGGFETFDTRRGLASNDVRGVTLERDGTVWAATAAGLSMRRPDGAFTTLTTAQGLASNNVRAVHGPWSARRALASGLGGRREPAVARDGAGNLWLAYAHHPDGGTAEDTWLLRYRRFDAGSFTWGEERELTRPPALGRATDREPGIVALPGGGARVYFRSDRSGGTRLWSVSVDAAGDVGAPELLTDGPEADTAPVPVALGDGTVWLFHRSDRSVALSGVGSARIAEEGSLRRHAGSTSIVLSDLARAGLQRRWGDLLAYTPQRPANEAPLTDDELYTRGTLGLYVSRTPFGDPLTADEGERVRQLLHRFLPINTRAVLVLAPSLTVESMYPAGQDIEERYQDNHPFIDTYPGPADGTSAALPGWKILASNTKDDVSVDPGRPTTWRRRTFFFPPG
ncbi:phage tail protein [Myxococcus sp. RHSTA-1-4]|uniref:phage tail protein n=1 Tax=Myxococcus sp. RHSTA-1-4 TaxID=2874601 RepID=UPI001CBC8DE5|nr:phage tail protein [Myxococcus sp. RHSTA-1-4]MBZ4417427.1 hypothetical protein [Myxococcus sp. RHSTA-1-4]